MSTKTKTRGHGARAGRSTDPRTLARNEVHLVGRLSAPPAVKYLPSGAEVVQLRLVVDRPAGSIRRTTTDGTRPVTVDTIDVACWKADLRRRAMSWTGTETVEVTGALRRRFWRGAHGVASRYEVEADQARAVK
ncbi:single-stranded DNA-binding protein [Flexivirga oryzae]|uniref:Single-strand DNA-binding protein n=1 Tax=Flexivirga oryzae TaxID=1794944 RepID=A0A839N7Q8_9MICO|nr:single-stranded DNA-binding protein [Flexivirga oryzae]MBB2891255.1 single-strand DNA-binding protein [Flexivirga oryzae]